MIDNETFVARKADIEDRPDQPKEPTGLPS